MDEVAYWTILPTIAVWALAGLFLAARNTRDASEDTR